jgi:cytosine/adenosine deaminase-related metal-dependent hydrolase
MTRLVLGPCSPFSVSTDLLQESAKLARACKVSLHTHLCETMDEERFTLERYQLRPVAWMATLDWMGSDVWFAHAIHVDDDEIQELGRGGVGVAHCPCSNMRLASGIAPIKKYMAAGVKVGLGVDGSASNDASNILLEARQACCWRDYEWACCPPRAHGSTSCCPSHTRFGRPNG